MGAHDVRAAASDAESREFTNAVLRDLSALERMWAEVSESDLLGANVLERVRSFARLRVALQDPLPLRELLERSLPVRTFSAPSIRSVFSMPRWTADFLMSVEEALSMICVFTMSSIGRIS